MQQITNLTSSVKQQMRLSLKNNETADFFLHYNARIQAWFFDFTYNDITAKNLKVCLHPNILRSFRRLIPFGISFWADNQVEPFQLTSFSSGACNMYILSEDEVAEVEEAVYDYTEPDTKKNVGDYETLSDLQDYDDTLTNGDYGFVIDNGVCIKYTWNGQEWVRA